MKFAINIALLVFVSSCASTKVDREVASEDDQIEIAPGVVGCYLKQVEKTKKKLFQPSKITSQKTILLARGNAIARELEQNESGNPVVIYHAQGGEYVSSYGSSRVSNQYIQVGSDSDSFLVKGGHPNSLNGQFTIYRTEDQSIKAVTKHSGYSAEEKLNCTEDIEQLREWATEFHKLNPLRLGR